MNIKTTRFFLAFLAFAVLGSAESRAQFYYWSTAVTNGQWNDTANWDGGVVPNESGAVVYFDNAGTVGVGLNGFTATVGELNVANSATFGSTTNSDDFLNLDNGATQPIVSAASPSGNTFMYAEVTGTNGFRKTGSGRFTFRYNPNNQTYTGKITLAGGTLGINQDGSLGDPANDIVVETTSTLISEPGNNANPVTLGAGRDISIAAGATLAMNNTAAAVTTTVNGNISGDGGLTFGGTGSLILNGTNAYLGATTINSPGSGGVATNATIVGRTNLISFAGSASLPVTNALNFSLGSSAAFNSVSVVGVNLGGVTVLPSILVIGNNSATTSTNSLLAYDITNGGLVYSSPASTFNFSARGASAVTNELRLPDTTTLSFSNVVLGGVGASQNAMLSSRVLIGSNATINASQFTLAAYRASGLIEARAAGASLKMRSSDGTSAVPQILIGNFSGGPNPVATINMGNGSIDLSATTIEISKNVANNSGANGSLQFGGGTAVAAAVVVGVGANIGNATVTTANTNALTASVTQNGGSATFSNVVLGRSLASDPTRGPVHDRYTATYNLNGGTLATALINTDSTNTAVSGMTRTFNLNGGTLRGYDASSDLIVTATTNAFAAIGFFTGTTNSKTIAVDAGRSINFAPGVEFQANGGTTTFELASDSVATLQGRFRIGVSSTNDAAVVISNGMVNLASTYGIFGIGDRTNGASALNISGGAVTIGLTNNRMVVGNKYSGALNVTGGSLTVAGNQNIYVGGDSDFGVNDAQGTWTVSGGAVNIAGSGAFVLGLNSTNTNGVITTNIAGTLNLNGGSFTTARAITAGTNGTSTGTVNFNGGTLAVSADIPNLLAVTTATVASNSTIDTGTFDSGLGQNLAGSGTLTVGGSGTLRLNGTNAPPVAVSSGATLGGTGSVGTATVNGTLAPGPAATNGTFMVTSSLSVPGTARFRIFANAVNDKVLASGGANLSGGTVAVTIADTNYVPASGDTFDLVDGTISGSPALSLPALSGGLVWVTNNFASTGTLSVTNNTTPTNSYANWLTNYPTLTGPDTNGSADPDGDGFINNLEFAFDGNPTVGTPALITATRSGSNAVVNWIERSDAVAYEVQVNTNLASPWTGPAAVTISNAANQTGILIPADYVRKEFVVPATGKDFYRVKAAITNN